MKQKQSRFWRFCSVHPTYPIVLLFALFAHSLSAATVSWVGGSGDWNTGTNWSTGAIPGPNDDVVINPANVTATITHSSGSHAVNSLASQVAFQLSGGTLAVSNTIQVNNTLTLSGGTLARATLLQGTNSALVVVTVNSALDGVTFGSQPAGAGAE